jgi:hypothetical protein
MSRKNKDKIDEPQDELVALEYTDLVELIQFAQDQRSEKMNQRIYLQLERDLVANLHQHAQEEARKIGERALVEERLLALCEEEHRTEVKTYLQKLKQLDFENERNLMLIDQQAQVELDQEADHHDTRLGKLKHEKTEANEKLLKSQQEGIKEIHKREQDIKNVLELGKATHAQELKSLEVRLEESLEQLQRDLDLKIRVELHEIEERKNFHINELIRNHEKAFDELKAFYSFITVENLNLIKSQKEELSSCRGRHESNQKKLQFLKEKNVALEVGSAAGEGRGRKGDERPQPHSQAVPQGPDFPEQPEDQTGVSHGKNQENEGGKDGVGAQIRQSFAKNSIGEGQLRDGD